MFEKGRQERDREVLDRQLAGTDPEPLRGKDHEQPEAFGVAQQGVGTEATFAGQVDLQESGEMGSKVSHGILHAHEPTR